MAANQTCGQLLPAHAGAEPKAHHLPTHSFRSQQRHCRQTDRTQAQLTKRQHQDAAHQPEWSSLHRRERFAASIIRPARRAENTNNELVMLLGRMFMLASAMPSQIPVPAG